MNFMEAAFLKGFKPRSKMTGSQWADTRRVIPPGPSPEPGEWRTDRTPYLREPMDAMTDKQTEMVVMCCASQLGKSECLINVLGYYIDQNPATILMVQPTIALAEAFSKERLAPTIRYSPGLQDKFELDGKDGRGSSRKSSNTIRQKQFPGGFLAMEGSNSPRGLAGRPIQVLLCDEIDGYEATKEGDPLKLAIQRTSNFNNKKILLVSTPVLKETSKIWEYYERSDKREFYITCPHCGEEYVWKWNQVRWEKDKDGNALPETAKMFCPHCGCQVRGAYKLDTRILATGRWKPSAKSKIKGYHINSLYSPWVDLCKLVEEFTFATKNRDKKGLQEFVNLRLGEPWEEAVVGEDAWEQIHLRREYYGDNLPEGVLLLTCGVDVQRDRLECSLYGWGDGKECWGIEHRIIRGDPGGAELWQALDGFLLERRTLPNGIALPVSCTCVDSGDGQYTQNVYEYTRPREKMNIFSVKGSSGGVGVPFVSRPSRNNRLKAALFVLGVHAGKSLVMNALQVEGAGPGYVHLAKEKERGFDEEFCQQLCSERLERTFENGVVKIAWKKIRDRNEAFDCAVYARAALEICNPNFAYLASVINGQKAKQSAAAPMPTGARRKRGVMSKGVSL